MFRGASYDVQAPRLFLGTEMRCDTCKSITLTPIICNLPLAELTLGTHTFCFCFAFRPYLSMLKVYS